MRPRLVASILTVLLAACGGMLPTIVEGLPAEIGGEPLADRPIAAGELGAALAAENLPRDAATGHEARWGDETRLVILIFETIGLGEASRVSRAILDIGEVESQISVVGTQTAFELTGPGIPGVAYEVTKTGDGSEIVMYTFLAPTDAEAATIADAIVELHPSDE